MIHLSRSLLTISAIGLCYCSVSAWPGPAGMFALGMVLAIAIPRA